MNETYGKKKEREKENNARKLQGTHLIPVYFPLIKYNMYVLWVDIIYVCIIHKASYTTIQVHFTAGTHVSLNSKGVRLRRKLNYYHYHY